MKKGIWLSYDLGVQGDYDHLYAWLDNHKAVECGDSMAFLEFDIPAEINDNDFIEKLKKDMESSINFNPGNRVYVIRRVKDDKKDSFFGRFIMGNRKASPWEGYGDSSEQIEDGKS